MPSKDPKDQQQSQTEAENEKFNGSTTLMANLLGVNKAQARDLLAEVQAEGQTVDDVRVEKQENAELGSTGLEMIAEVAHSAFDPMTAVATSAGMTSVKDDAKEPEPKKNPSALPVPRPEGRTENKSGADSNDEVAQEVAPSEPSKSALSSYKTPTPFDINLTRKS